MMRVLAVVPAPCALVAIAAGEADVRRDPANPRLDCQPGRVCDYPQLLGLNQPPQHPAGMPGFLAAASKHAGGDYSRGQQIEVLEEGVQARAR